MAAAATGRGLPAARGAAGGSRTRARRRDFSGVGGGTRRFRARPRLAAGRRGRPLASSAAGLRADDDPRPARPFRRDPGGVSRAARWASRTARGVGECEMPTGRRGSESRPRPGRRASAPPPRNRRAPGRRPGTEPGSYDVGTLDAPRFVRRGAGSGPTPRLRGRRRNHPRRWTRGARLPPVSRARLFSDGPGPPWEAGGNPRPRRAPPRVRRRRDPPRATREKHERVRETRRPNRGFRRAEAG